MDEAIRPGIPEELLTESTDPREWAREFMRLFEDRRDEIDEGLMIGWFANLMDASTHRTAREIAQALKVVRGDDDDLPQQGEWPCQYNPVAGMAAPPRIVPFLYRLLRDGASAPSDVEGHALSVRVHDEETREIKYTNPHLLAYAQSLAGYLLAWLPAPVPSEPGDIDPAIERLLNTTADLTAEDWPPELSEVVEAVNGLAASYYARNPS